MFFHSKEKSTLETKILSVKMNVENNYMDLAKLEYKEASELLEEYHNTGRLNEREYKKFSEMLGRYSFVGGSQYGHTNISKFLKERG